MNKNKLSAFILMLTAFVVMLGSLNARGGGRGGGGARGGGGGAYRGGQTMNRTPTMSRATSVNRPQMQQARPQFQQARPQFQQARPQIQQARPQIQQARPQVQQARQQIQTRPQIQQARSQIQQSRPQIQQARINQQPINRDQLRSQVSQQTQGINSRLDQNVLSERQSAFSNQHLSKRVNNNQLSLNVSDRMRSIRPGYNQWFDNNFFRRHDLTPEYGRPGVNWWRAANWGAVASWGAWNWATPYYYDDAGYALAVTAPQESYSQDSGYSQDVGVQGGSVQGSAPAVSGDWMPLGVFAMGRNANEAALSNRILQLALNRNGEISGVVYNSAQDSAKVVVGAVDPNSQQAFWSLADRQDSPIVATGLYNLTEAQTPITVMFTDGSKQNWVLVRLQN